MSAALEYPAKSDLILARGNQPNGRAGESVSNSVKAAYSFGFVTISKMRRLRRTDHQATCPNGGPGGRLVRMQLQQPVLKPYDHLSWILKLILWLEAGSRKRQEIRSARKCLVMEETLQPTEDSNDEGMRKTKVLILPNRTIEVESEEKQW